MQSNYDIALYGKVELSPTDAELRLAAAITASQERYKNAHSVPFRGNLDSAGTTARIKENGPFGLQKPLYHWRDHELEIQ